MRNEQDLVPFDGESTFVIKVGDYESNNFECNVSLKYNYEYENDEDEESYNSEGNDSCEFELLVDPLFEQKKHETEVFAGTRKFSDNIISDRHSSPQSNSKKSTKSMKELSLIHI